MNESMFSLEGKVAIVTGAAGYLGKAFSDALFSAGAKVDLYGRGEKIKNLAEEFLQMYGEERVAYHTVDFYNEKAFRAALKDTIKQNETVDILVNNAFEFSKETGFNDPSGKMENISKEQWMRSLEYGVYWAALATQVVGEQMKKQGSGAIINIGSIYGLISPDPKLYKGTETFNPPSYGAAKSAVLALTRYTAAFYGEFRIRCNSIVLGAFPNVDQKAYNSPDKKILKRLSDKTVLKRYGSPEDLKGVLVFLASDSSSYITGQALVVDGGWTIT